MLEAGQLICYRVAGRPKLLISSTNIYDLPLEFLEHLRLYQPFAKVGDKIQVPLSLDTIIEARVIHCHRPTNNQLEYQILLGLVQVHYVNIDLYQVYTDGQFHGINQPAHSEDIPAFPKPSENTKKATKTIN